MTTREISEDALLAQEACFARAFADGDPTVARDLYQPEVSSFAEGRERSRAVGRPPLEKLINRRTVYSASEYVYHHPDDGSVLASLLPQPKLTTISMQGQGAP